MSGLEVVGLLLGVFPLIISAMEHYEDVKGPTVIWRYIRRTHKRDYGKVKDCQFAFGLQLEKLLFPLLADDVVDEAQYEQLLAEAGSDNWKQSHVETALSDRLGDRCERYLEVLEELKEAMNKLCTATRVDDPAFQRAMNDRQSRPGNQLARTVLMSRANAKYQAQRLKYSMTKVTREELLEEVEGYIRRLRDLLAASDDLSALPRRQRHKSTGPVSRKILDFWTHADNIFRLVKDAWHCTCRSSVCLWLQQNCAKTSEMRMQLVFCHGGHGMVVKLSDEPPTIRINPHPKFQTAVSVSSRTVHGLAQLAIRPQRQVLL
ncbi:hypothetical protein LTR17_022687 [Elasticomyces elasticus]|nr:hypothetical protein LTR17_022687 [Elasticomyces elasticus]